MVRTWQERLLQCVKLPTHVVAPADKPNIAIVNRPYDAGRGFLNLDEVAAHIEVSAAACIPSPAAGCHLIVPQHVIHLHCSCGLCMLLQLNAGHALLSQLDAHCWFAHPQELHGRLRRQFRTLTWMAPSCCMCNMLTVRPASAAELP